MDFDPLLLFTPAKPFQYEDRVLKAVECPDPLKAENYSSLFSPQEELDLLDLEDIPMHAHDLPLLRLQPPSSVLFVFLQLLAPNEVCNFAPSSGHSTKDTYSIFIEKSIERLNVDGAVAWLLKNSTRFGSAPELASVAHLAQDLRRNHESEYNSWLTRIVSSALDWVSLEDREDIVKLSSLRLAENCGRTAQPEMIRNIEIPALARKLRLKEPSLTSDNLGLKTWGSSFILGSRLALNPELLVEPVLELGSGTGLVGMVSCALGHTTTLTDLAEIVPNLRENIALNNIDNAVVEELDWSNPSQFVARNGSNNFNTIILSDPLYSSKHPFWIVDMVNMFLDNHSLARVLLQVPIRRNFEKERDVLWKLMKENGYTVEEEATETGFDDFGESSYSFKKYKRCV